MLIQFGDIEIDTAGCELRLSSELQSLEPKAFDLLLHLIKNRDRVISKDEIYEVIWDGRLISEATLTSSINAARTAIGDSGKLQKYIRTYPRRGYRFIGEVSKEPASLLPQSELQGNTGQPFATQPAVPVSAQPSIVVLPFAIAGADLEQEFLAEGIASDITADLSRFRRLFVVSHTTAKSFQSRVDAPQDIAKQLGVRYALEGNVRKNGNKVRVVVQLLDCHTGQTVWAERYDHVLDDVFLLEDQIAEAVVTSIEPEILTYERGRLGGQTTENMGAWQLLQKGLWHYYQQNRDAHYKATQLFREAVEIDPEYSHALAHLAFALWTSAIMARSETPDLALMEAKKLATAALARDPDEPLARFTLGRICLLEGDIGLAIEHMVAGTKAAPNYAGCHYGLGLALYHGQAEAEKALAHFEFATRLNPRNPMIWATYEKQCCANRLLGQFEDAVMFGLKACGFSNENYRPHITLAAALVANGKADDAQLELDKSRRFAPDLSIAFVEQQLIKVHPTVRNDLVRWLQVAGLDK